MLGNLIQGRYQVVQVLSAGGFCQTYLAHDTNRFGNPTCVIKHLKSISNNSDSLSTLRQLFIREAQALKKLRNHNQVPRLIDHFEDNQKFYLVQEFIEGHLLSAELQPGQRWSESQVVQLLQEVLSILEFVHCHGLIHQDITPSNLIRRKQDNRLVLIDFGSVQQTWTQVVTQGQTSANLTLGTPGYMPLEQGRGRPRRNSDIYALGIIAIQALTGSPVQLLEESDTGELIWQDDAKVCALLASVLNKMVRYHFRDRYQSAIEALQALQPLVDAKNGAAQGGASSIFLSSHPFLPSPSLNKPALLIGMGIGIVFALLVMFGSCYYLRSHMCYSHQPAPTLKVRGFYPR